MTLGPLKKAPSVSGAQPRTRSRRTEQFRLRANPEPHNMLPANPAVLAIWGMVTIAVAWGAILLRLLYWGVEQT
jgi:hypothetical protein